MFFGSIKILFHHGQVSFECIINGANRLVEETRIFNCIQNFFCAFNVTAFHVLLDKAKRSEEEMAENQSHSNEIGEKCGPKAAIDLGHNSNCNKGQRDI